MSIPFLNEGAVSIIDRLVVTKVLSVFSLCVKSSRDIIKYYIVDSCAVFIRTVCWMPKAGVVGKEKLKLLVNIF